MKAKGLDVRLWVGLIVLLVIFLTLGANASAADEIEVGVIAPMKFMGGEAIWNGAQFAADEINAAGGIRIKGKRYQIALHKTDDNCFSSVQDAVSAMQRLVTVKKVDFVIGGYRSEAVLAQQEVMADNKVIFLGVAAAHDELSARVAKDYDRYKYWFRVCPTRSTEMGKNYIAMTEPVLRALTKLGIKKPKVAILADKAHWADPMVELATKLYPQMGCEVIGVWRPSWNATSVTAELSAIKSAGAHMIFQMTAGPAGNVYSKQWGELMIPAALTGTNIEGFKESHWKTTSGKCNYMMTGDSIATAEKTEKTRPFLAAYSKRFGEDPTSNGVGAYDALNLLKEAIERAGSFDVDAVIPELEKTDYIGPTGRITFTPVGHETPHNVIWGPNNITMVGMQWRNGERCVFWPDGREIHPAILATGGVPRGWDKIRYEGTTDYVLPPWVVEYWKDKK